MCEAAEIDLGLPYSPMCDVLDKVGDGTVARWWIERELLEALDAWDADQTGYQFNARALDYGASDYDPADDEE